MSRTVSAPSGLTIITVADLPLRVDDRVATYKLADKTYTVFRPGYGMTVPELVEGAKLTDRDMNAWIEEDAWQAGLRVEF